MTPDVDRNHSNPRPWHGLLVAVTMLFVVVLPLQAQAQDTSVIINEFQAVNETTLADNTGQYEDWIELVNRTASPVDLGGWVLADSTNVFHFAPGTMIDPGGFLVVFASGDVARTTPTEVHLPFRLSQEGESLTLQDPGGFVVGPAWVPGAPYPPQLTDTSYGVDPDGSLGVMVAPSPGEPNATGAGGVVEPVRFSVDHGFYNTTQSVVLDSDTRRAQIRYTTDGSTPSADVGTLVPAGTAVDVSSTTTLRAIAFRPGWIASNVETRTYIFASDVARQPESPPAGWPADGEVSGITAVYGMGPHVSPASVEQSLLSIPVLSITTDLENLFDPTTGIWTNPRERGVEWERAVSVELIDPTGAQPGFEINGGLRIKGNSSRAISNFKHSLRLSFGNEYGDGDLEYPLFGPDAASVFESLDLLTSQSLSWNRPNIAPNPVRGPELTFLRNEWTLETQGAMGQPHARAIYVNVFLNGQHWGIYNLAERVSNQFASQYTGGNESDFDLIKRDTTNPSLGSALHVEALDGSLDDWLSLWPLVSDVSLTDAEWAIFRQEVDLVSLADFYLLSFFSGDGDSTPRFTGDVSNNWLAFRNRAGVGTAARWQFNDRDSESALCTSLNAGRLPDWDPTPPWNLRGGDYLPPENFLAPAWLFESAITQPEFVQIFQDRVSLHMLTPGGALTVAESVARLDRLSAVVGPAIDAEAARWGGKFAQPALGRADWTQAVADLRGCFELRTEVIEQYLREDGLWPVATAPTVSPDGGLVAPGTTVTVSATGPNVWVTTDGSDPRGIDGSVSPNAFRYTGPISITSPLTFRVRVLDANLGWSPLTEAVFTVERAGGPVLALNEYNAVSSSRFLGDGTAADIANGSDATLGRVAGNGGDWFELVVIDDGLDIRGWSFDIWHDVDGVSTFATRLTLGDDEVFSDLLAGSLVTISEDLADDISYAPRQGDWNINLQSNDGGEGAYITAATQSNFPINNDNTQIAIFDSAGAIVQPRTGEGTAPQASVSSTEVFKLETAPTLGLTSRSGGYDDGVTSTWGQPNAFASGAEVQDLDNLRLLFGDANCDGSVRLDDALAIVQFSVGLREGVATCPLADPTTQVSLASADVADDTSVNPLDALLIAQCSVGITNESCPAARR